MYRIGDKVVVVNYEPYHNWREGVTAIVHGDTINGVLDLKSEDSPNGYIYQGLYPRDVKFVSRTDYRPDDYAIVVGHSYSHSMPIGAKVKVIGMREHVADLVVNVVYEEEHLYQGVHPDSLLPIEFAIEPLTSPEAHPVSYARAVPNDVVTVHTITDRPRCEDDSLFTEFTSWQHALTEQVRGVEEGLVIDAYTVITFLGTNDEGDDIFSIRYEDTKNIVIAKGKLNNGYAKYRA